MAGEINFGAVNPNAFAQGFANTNAMLQQVARIRAGRALADGNQTDAVQTLQRFGDMEGADNIVKGQQQRTTFQNQQDDRLTAMEDHHKAESAKMILDVATTLSNVKAAHQADPDGGMAATLAGFDQLAPIFTAKGAKPEELAMYRDQLAKDPDTFLTGIAGKAQQALYHFQNAGNTIVRTNERTGEAVPVFTAPEKAQYIQADPSKDLVRVGGDQSGQAAPHSPSGADPDAVIKAAYPGAVITSRDRTLAEQRRLNPSLPDGAHTQGRARDIRPMPGMSAGAIKKAYEDAGYSGVHAVYEGPGTPNSTGPHFHVEWTGAPAPAAADHAQNAAGFTVLRKGTPKPVGTQTGSLWTPQQVAAAGLEPGTVVKNTNSGPVVMQRPRANQGGAQGGPVKLNPYDAKQLAAVRTEVDQSQKMVGLVNEFMGLNREVNTGGMMALPGAGAAMAPFNSKIARMKSITDNLTPAMRNGLPGAASDRDVAMFRSATVGLDKPREANTATAAAVKAWAQRQGDYLAFMETYAQRHGNLLGAQEIWNNYASTNPMFTNGPNGPMPRRVTPWRSAINLEGGPSGKKGVYDPKTGKVIWQ